MFSWHLYQLLWHLNMVQHPSAPLDQDTVPRDAPPVPPAGAACERRLDHVITRQPAGATDNPEGIASLSPGLARTAPTLGASCKMILNPDGVASVRCGRWCCNPFRVVISFHAPTQGSSPTRNPGLSAGIPSGFPGRRAGRAGDDTPKPARKTRLTRGWGRRNVTRLALPDTLL
jgi:hypothetical protein